MSCLFDPEAVNVRYGFGPEHVADYKALVGDTSDNIPGVAGIGEKTAKALIAQYGDVEGILANLGDQITPPRAKNALPRRGFVDEASEQLLTTIVRDLPIEIDLDRSHVGNYDREAIVISPTDWSSAPSPTACPSRARPRRGPAARGTTTESVRTIVRAQADLERLAQRVRDVGRYAIDVETDWLDPILRQPGRHRHWSWPRGGVLHSARVESETWTNSPWRTSKQRCSHCLADARLQAYAHHAKYDLAVLARHG